MTVAARYYHLCRMYGVRITPAAALAWAAQDSYGLPGFFSSDASLALGVGRLVNGYVVSGEPTADERAQAIERRTRYAYPAIREFLTA